jgi:hypothetical protein
MITLEDIKDCDPDVWGDMISDSARAVNKKIDAHLYAILIAAGAGTAAATVDGWNVPATADPILDLMNARQTIKANGYATDDLIIYMNQAEERYLISWLVSQKGSSIPNFSSNLVGTGNLMQLLDMRVVVDSNCPTDSVTIFSPSKAVIYREFMPLTSAIVEDAGIGKTVRVWAEGVAVRPNPGAVFVITDTIN